MKKFKEELKYGKKGITLISLVVTIIVLLILAGVTINLTLGDNGIITRAQSATKNYKLAEINEQVNLKNAESAMDDRIITSGTLESVLGTSNYNAYADKLYVLGGNLVYNPDTCSSEEIANAKQAGIKSMAEYKTIKTAEELKKFRDEVNAGNSYEGQTVYLVNSIDLQGSEENQWSPIRYYDTTDEKELVNQAFKGTFDGCGNEIYRLYIHNEDERYQGLFGCNAGIVQNVNISESSYIMGKGNTGSIVGYNLGIVRYSINKATVESNNNNTGGIVGKNIGTLKNCQNIGIVSSTGLTTGGITGWNCSNGIIENCKNDATVTTEKYMVGGICGSNDGKIIKSCNYNMITANGYNIINSTQKASNIGGIVGTSTGEILNCYNVGEVFSEYSNVGGICGYSSKNNLVSNCYNIGKISGENATGAIGGWLNGKISNCYYLNGSATNGYNDKVSSEEVVNVNQSFMTSNDFLNVLNNNEINYKIISEINNGYPILSWQ